MESSETSLKSPRSYADVFNVLRTDINGVEFRPALRAEFNGAEFRHALRADINGVEATPTERVCGPEGLT